MTVPATTPAPTPGRYPLRLVPAGAQDVRSRRDALLRRSGASGQRDIVALHQVLTEHAPTPSGPRLICACCRPVPGGTYPCRTAEIVLNTLTAILG